VKIFKLKDCPEFTAGDRTILRELFHPDKTALDLRYSLAHAVLKPGKTSIRHRLKTSEVYYILEGVGRMHIDHETEELHAHEAVYIPPRTIQWIENNGKQDLVFLCIVDPAWRLKDEEVLE
jgi:mannose-6-phosphate isomerase-like protein (cupin superfamily)